MEKESTDQDRQAMAITIDEGEVVQLLEAIENGSVALRAQREPQDVYAGNVAYASSNGWRLTVFNDANEWDYIDSIESPDGRSLRFDEIDLMPAISQYRPTPEVAWTRYGIPGYCTFRCVACGSLLKSKQLRQPPFLCRECLGKATV